MLDKAIKGALFVGAFGFQISVAHTIYTHNSHNTHNIYKNIRKIPKY